MVVALLLLLVVVAVAAAYVGWRKTGIAAGCVTVLGLWAVSCGTVPAALLQPLQHDFVRRVQPDWGKRNVIIVLGYGTIRPAAQLPVEPLSFAYPRIMTGAQLYQDCRSRHADCKLLVSGGDALGTGEPEAMVYRHALIALGVRAADILTDADSMNTWQNAQFTATLLRRHPANRVLLVTSSFHLRRSLLYFAHFGVAPTPWRADLWQPRAGLRPRGENLAIAEVALHEWLGIARYHYYNWMGWNPQRSGAGQA